MSFTNVRLILSREIRDQLRDRRTLFMIFVLPILLYPLLGMSLSQMMQFRHERPTSVLVIGVPDLADRPYLFREGEFNAELFANTEKREVELLELHFAAETPRGESAAAADPREAATRAVQAGHFDAALYFPADFAQRLQAFRRAIEEQARSRGTTRPIDAVVVASQVPGPEIIYTSANERSQIARARLSAVLHRWTEEVGKTNLAASGVPTAAVRPIDLQSADVAEQTPYRGAAIWSKILPIMLLLWAMTGAFYPAVDLCAGEKERGTLETLLSSPAERSEIVLGKLLTIMLFSMATAALNLASVGITGELLFGHLPTFGSPPPLAILWLAVALLPVSALFSALCLALAAFARSTKEGQYYLMPLLLVTMPLAVLPMTPGVELSLGNSLIPVTGIVLLLRSVLEGAYWQALQYLPGVVAVTLIACWLAVRWAVDQFNSESVLFREGERFDLALWLRHLLRDRQPTPTVAAAMFCGVLILLVRFVAEAASRPPEDFAGFARLAVITQLVVIVGPALLMTFALTGSPRQTLLLRLPHWQTIPAALALAVAVHPVIMALRVVIDRVYPIGEELKQAMSGLDQMFVGAPWWQVLLVLAVLPAICEELAFRGFILSGFRHLGHNGRAVVYSAIFFGLAHGAVQQSLMACLLGIVIAYVAVQSGSLLPGMLFHVVHNALVLTPFWVAALLDRWPALNHVKIVIHSLLTKGKEMLDRWPALSSVLLAGKNELTYPWPVAAAGAAVAVALLVWFASLPRRSLPVRTRTEEERCLSAAVAATTAEA
jgi:sodium transport system permease protein